MRYYKRGKTWHIDYYNAEGQRIRESTKCTDRREAEEFGRKRQLAARDPDRAAREGETLITAFQRLVDNRSAKVELGEGSARTVSVDCRQ